ncbi:MAG: CBS domain-containing protein [Bacteroidota bacterium]|jgi:CBS domain-containing protein
MKVSDILKSKGSNVYSVPSTVTVYDALKTMGEKNIGALLIMDNEELLGIFSERDYARKIILKGKNSHETLVREIMTEKVISVVANDEIETCMELMSGKRIRHLPVMNGNRVIGVISITDVVTAIIAAQKETISLLHNYISQ